MRGIKLAILMIFGVLTVSSAAEKWWKSALSDSGRLFSSLSAVNQARASSIILQLHGNVYPNGFYFAQVNIGQPPKPYFLDPDTGSDLTWLQCDAPCLRCTKAPHPLYKPNNNLVGCKDPLCASLHSGDQKCETLEQCDYDVQYADGGSSLGILLNDVFSLNLTNGVQIAPHLALGCGYDQEIGHSYHPLDGVLGLGKGPTSILSQLKKKGLVQNVVGHCLSRQGGYLFFGDEVYDASQVVWTSMSRDYEKHYSPGSAELIFGGISTGVKNLLVIFDSGSSYSYLQFEPYQAFISLVEKELSGKPLRKANDDNTLPLCWKGRKAFKSVQDAKQYFKPFALSFAKGWKGRSQFEIPPESYLIISSKGNVCLGVLNGSEAGLHDVNIIGDISMQDKMVIYDNEKKSIGWTPAKCDQPPKSSNIPIPLYQNQPTHQEL
nr:aspartic proteinase Asp1-like isoform X1 [Ipomoea trifida]